jgi:hypothetical protein
MHRPDGRGRGGTVHLVVETVDEGAHHTVAAELIVEGSVVHAAM